MSKPDRAWILDLFEKHLDSSGFYGKIVFHIQDSKIMGFNIDRSEKVKE